MAKFKTTIVNLFLAVMAIISVTSCVDSEDILGGEAPSETVVVSDKTPVYLHILEGGEKVLIDEDHNTTHHNYDSVVVKLVATPETATVGGSDIWAFTEESREKSGNSDGFGGNTKWQYNYAAVQTTDSVYAIYKGRKLPLWKPERLHVRMVEDGAYVADDTTTLKVEYSLFIEGYEKPLARANQVLCTKVGFVDEFLGIRILRQSHQFGSGVYDTATGILTCVDTVFYAERWKSGFKSEQYILAHMENHISNSISGQIVADLTQTVGKTWTGNSANLGGLLINLVWTSKNIREEKLEVLANNQTFNLKDSVQHVCRWNPDGGKVESAEKIRLDFAREGVPADYCKAYKDVDIKQRTIVDVIYSFLHKAFNKKASVSGKTLTVKCDNGSKFQPKFDDDTLGEVVEGNFLETLTFNLSHPDYVASAAKGKTYSVDANGKVTVEGQVWSITFASRTIGSIPYNGKEYKNDPKVPQCMATPTTIYFCSDCDSVEYTFKHESEIIKGREKVTYNFVVDYEVVEEHHDTWGQISSSNGTWTLPCSNYVLVVPIYKDGTRGQAEKLDYTAYNSWKLIKMLQAEVVNPTDYIGTTVQIVDGKATVAGLGESILGHTMSANKVTKGNWSHQPGNCPADATYFTIISTTEARVDVYHDSKKIREFVVPISLVQKLLPITINGEIVRIDRTHAYQNQHGSYEGTYWHILVKLADGSYIDYVIREESYNKNLSLQQNMKEYKLSASDGNQIVNTGEALALIWTGSNWVVGTVTSEDGKAAVGAYIEYHYQGQLAYTLGNGTGTHSQGNKGFPSAILGSWTAPSADGTWPITIAGQKFTLQGS